MSFRDDLAGVLACDPRYSIHAYAFVFEALEFTKAQKRKAATRTRDRKRPKGSATRHVSGRELCEGAKLLALAHYGMMALAVLAQWGIHSTSDLGEIVFNLIRSGDLERSPHDNRSDFDDVFEFEDAFRREFVLPLDDVA